MARASVAYVVVASRSIIIILLFNTNNIILIRDVRQDTLARYIFTIVFWIGLKIQPLIFESVVQNSAPAQHTKVRSCAKTALLRSSAAQKDRIRRLPRGSPQRADRLPLHRVNSDTSRDGARRVAKDVKLFLFSRNPTHSSLGLATPHSYSYRRTRETTRSYEMMS